MLVLPLDRATPYSYSGIEIILADSAECLRSVTLSQPWNLKELEQEGVG